MVNETTNWVHEKGYVTERDRIALERAKDIERKQESEGYRWITINERLQVFVPCGNDGKPTKEGERKISLLKSSQGIK